MLGEIVGKVSFVEFGTVGALEVQQFLRPNTQVWFSWGSLAKLCAKSLAIVLYRVAGWDRTGFWPFHKRGKIQHLNGPANHHLQLTSRETKLV